jgi:putative ABC transport system ATP-binding protein
MSTDVGTNVLIQVENLSRFYTMGRETVQALNGVSLTVHRNEFLGITGPSGSGKSTLLYLLGGLDRPTGGRIFVNGQDISSLDEDGLADYRQRQVGFVFQMFNLVATMTALENVEFPLLFSGVNPQERHRRARETLELVGLGDRIHHRPSELSGGQQQRVAIARSLMNNPAIILADEPTGNLDSHSGSEIMNILNQLNNQGRTLIVVSHDPSLVSVTPRMIRLLDGQIIENVERPNA